MRNISISFKKIFLLTLIISFSLFATSQSHTVTVLSEKANETTLLFKLKDYEIKEVVTEYGKANVITAPGAPNILEKGFPHLFYLSRSIVIPDFGAMEIEIIPGEYKEINDIVVAPSKGNLKRNVNPSIVPFEKGAVYNMNDFFPLELASLRKPYILRDFRGQSVDVFPVQYNPITKTLRVYSEIKVVFRHTSKRGQNELMRSKRANGIDPEFGHIYRSIFINYSEAKYPILDDEGELLVICYDEFLEAMQPFLSWKRTTGLETTMIPLSAVGTTNTEIKAFIKGFYNGPTRNLTHVLLVGDAEQIPTNLISSGHSDNAYGYIVGDDSYSDVFIGRFSAETIEQVETQVQRTIEYERDLNQDDTWLNIGMGVARNEGPGHNGEYDHQHMDFIRDTLLNYTYTEVLREYDGGVPDLPNTTATQISEGINNGVSIINYCNHGSETSWSVAGYNTSHVNALTNVGRLPFIWAVACVNGSFVGLTCFAETWLRATHEGQPSGAIGTMMSTINQAWDPPMTGQDEMVGILAESFENNIKRTFGGISVNGSMKMLDLYGSVGVETHDTWTLFGDPTLKVRTDVPQQMNVSHNPTIFLGSTFFNVTCDTEKARVTLSHTNDDGVTQIIGTNLVQDGHALIEFESPIVQPWEITVAATAYNKETYLSKISALPADEPYVILKSFATDVTPEFGGQVDLSIVLENISEVPYTAFDVEATLSTESPYASIISGSIEVGSIEPGDTIALGNAYSIDIANNVPNQTPIIFTITIIANYNDESYTWEQNFLIRANAPDLIIGNLIIIDEEQESRIFIDPGETAEISIDITNIGQAVSPKIIATLYDESSYITINENNAVELDSLEVGESMLAFFNITAAENTPLEFEAPLRLDLIADEYEYSKTLKLVVGQIPEYLLGSDSIVSSCIGRFYDSGGPNANYSNNEDFIVTFYPTSDNLIYIFEFTEFSIEQGYDFLYIYDGKDTSSVQFPGSPFTGTDTPGKIAPSNPLGAVTFHFISDEYINAPGWEALFYCESRSSLDAELFDFDFEEDVVLSVMVPPIENNSTSVYVTVTSGTDVTSLTPTFTISEGATVDPHGGQVMDFSSPVDFVVISQNGITSNTYSVKVREYGQSAVVLFKVTDSHQSAVANATIDIEGVTTTLETNSHGMAVIELNNGSYNFSVITEHHHQFNSSFIVDGDDKTVDVSLNLLGVDGISISQITIYPNPFNDYLIIGNADRVTRVTASNILGQVVMDKLVNDTSKVSTSHLKKGLYVITIETVNGERITHRMIKQ